MNIGMALEKMTQARVREVLSYDRNAGIFTWRQSSGRCKAGQKAGTVDKRGYVLLGVDGYRHWQAHRLVWLYVYGKWPEHEIDHINGQRADNRLANLRDVPAAINRQNMHKINVRNTSGFTGVHWCKHMGKWHAKVGLNGGTEHVGWFDDPVAASSAFQAAKRNLHPGYAP